MTPDKLDVHPQKMTVLKRIGDGGLSAWGGSLTARWGLPLTHALPSLSSSGRREEDTKGCCPWPGKAEVTVQTIRDELSLGYVSLLGLKVGTLMSQ